MADPVHQFPGIFGENKFFTRFPYVLPTVVAGMIGLTASIICAILIKETLVRDKESGAAKNSSPMSTWEILKSPGVAPVLYIYGHVMLLAFAYTAGKPQSPSNIWHHVEGHIYSCSRLLLYIHSTWRVRLLAPYDLHFHGDQRPIAINMDPHRLPVLAEEVRNRRCPPRMCGRLPILFHCMSPLQCIFAERLACSVLGCWNCKYSTWKRCKHVIQ